VSDESELPATGDSTLRNSAFRGRNGKGRYTRTLAGAKRDADAAHLRSRGLTYQTIANELGFSSAGKAYEGVQRAIASAPREAGSEALSVELMRLDELWRKALLIAEREHIVVSNGTIMLDPRTVGDHGGIKPLEDTGAQLAAIDRLVRISAQRAKLLGLEAPKRVQVDVPEPVRHVYELPDGITIDKLT
jgi:hypothetical protein